MVQGIWDVSSQMNIEMNKISDMYWQGFDKNMDIPEQLMPYFEAGSYPILCVYVLNGSISSVT